MQYIIQNSQLIFLFSFLTQNRKKTKVFFLSNHVEFPSQLSLPTPVSLTVIPTKLASLYKIMMIKIIVTSAKTERYRMVISMKCLYLSPTTRWRNQEINCPYKGMAVITLHAIAIIQLHMRCNHRSASAQVWLGINDVSVIHF